MVKRKGFTFIEISLFLAVTGALFIGIALGVSNSIFQQEYNDATQNFFEFLRSAYSKVSNPQSVGAGNSDYAIYGKLIVFGEDVDLLGETIPFKEQQIFSYDVIGGAAVGPSGDIKTLLKQLKINVAFLEKDGNLIRGVELSSPEKYTPRWEVGIENANGTEIKKSILIVRHPRSGTVNTLVYDGVIEANKIVRDAKNDAAGCIGQLSCTSVEELLTSVIDSFNISEMDFCINPSGLGSSGAIPRRDIRILKNARNASSVQILELEGENSICL